MTGDYGDFNASEGIDDPTHDPALIKHDGTYYVFSTGIARGSDDPGGIYVRKSEGSLAGEWEAMGEIEVPDWVMNYDWDEGSEPGHLWAPAVAEKDGTLYLYYSASQFGTNKSATGVASTSNPGNLSSWDDHGPVVESAPNENDFNAIDGSPVQDREGQWWLTFGSHWEGINMQKLNDSMDALEGERHLLQDRIKGPNAVEASNIIERNGYYYLFTSWDTCCDGVDSTYKISVGRSESITGPYVDKNGVNLKGTDEIIGGGSVILDSEDNQNGPGGQDVYEENGTYYLIHHYYDGDADGVIRMQVREMAWENGWPVARE